MHTDSLNRVLSLRPRTDARFFAAANLSNAELLALVREGNDAANAFRAEVDSLRERLDEFEADSNLRQLGAGARQGEPAGRQQRKAALLAYLRQGEQVGPDIKAELSVGSDPAGGYFVEPDTEGRIVRKIWESSPVRQLADVVPIRNESLQGILDLDEVGAGWVGEQDARSETATPDVGEYEIFAHEQYAMPIATQKILEDADRNVETWLERHISRKFARMEATAFVNGNGVKKPRGYLTYPTGESGDSTRADDSLQIVKTGASGAFAASDPADALYDLVFSLKAGYLSNATWLMNRTTMATVAKLKDGDGRYLLTTGGGIQQRTPFSLQGYPVLLADDMPAIAAGSNSIAFGDFEMGYRIVDRRGISLLRDPYTSKGKVKLYATRRVGGQVVDFDAIKLLNFAS